MLIIGAGIAGLSLAQKLAGAFPSKTVIVLAKGGQNESNSIYAQGGISTVVDSLHDSFAKHIDDTLMAGDGACNRKVVELVVSQGPGRLKELIDWGVVFDRNSNGSFNLHKEGGHSARRILHSHDFTGLTMVRALMEMVVKHKNVNLLKDAFAIDLLTNEHESGRCYGAAVLSPNGHTLNICSGATVLCTGGSGQVFRATTNPACNMRTFVPMSCKLASAVYLLGFEAIMWRMRRTVSWTRCRFYRISSTVLAQKLKALTSRLSIANCTRKHSLRLRPQQRRYTKVRRL